MGGGGGGGGGEMQAKYLARGSASKIFATMWGEGQHDYALIEWNYDLLTPSPGSGGWKGGVYGQNFATMLLYFMIPFNLICNMTMF